MDTKDVINVGLKCLFLAIACEALVELWKKAAPLQSFREWLINHTGFLYSEEHYTHLLDCGYCLSVWIAIILGVIFLEWNAYLPIYILCIHRLSNYIHLGFSLLRDKQLDLRIARMKDG